MKKMTKMISAILTMALILSSFGMVAFAETDMDVSLVEFVEIDKDGDGVNDTMQAKTMFTNTADVTAKGILLVAGYVDGKVVQASSAVSKDLAVGAKDLLIAEIPLTEGANYKGYTWNNANTAPVKNAATEEGFSGALLTDITIDGVSMNDYANKGSEVFSADKTSYSFTIPSNSVMPVVKGITSTENNNIIATTSYSLDSSAYPNVATATVVVKSGDIIKTYTLTFTEKAPNPNENFHSVVYDNGDGTYVDGYSDGFWEDSDDSTNGVAKPGLVWYPSVNGGDTGMYPGYISRNLDSGSYYVKGVEGDYQFISVPEDLQGLDYFKVPIYDFSNRYKSAIDYDNSESKIITSFKINKTSKIVLLSNGNLGNSYAGFNSVTDKEPVTFGHGGNVYTMNERYEKIVTVPDGWVVDVSIPVPTNWESPIIVIAPGETQETGIKPLVSEVTTHVFHMTWDSYWKYQLGEDAEIPAYKLAGIAGGANDDWINAGEYKLVEASSLITDGQEAGKLMSDLENSSVKVADRFHLIDISDASGLDDAFYMQGAGYYLIPGSYGNTWYAHEYLNPASTSDVTAKKPWWSFTVNADCEVVILADDYWSTIGFCEEYGYTKSTLSGKAYNGGMNGQVSGAYDIEESLDGKNRLMYTKKFKKGETVNLYTMYNSELSGEGTSFNLYMPYMVFVDFN